MTDTDTPEMPKNSPFSKMQVARYYTEADRYLSRHGSMNLSGQELFNLMYRAVRTLALSEPSAKFDIHNIPEYQHLVSFVASELADRGQIDADDADEVADLIGDAESNLSVHNRNQTRPAKLALQILVQYHE